MANKFIGDVDTVESITDEDSLFVNAADKLRKIKKNKVKLDYVNNINNKPRVNGVELSGDKSLDSLGIGSKTALDELSDKLNTCAPAIICEAQGKTIMVEDSSENYFNGLNIYGKTEQVQTKGYQLFDASKLPTKSQGGATVTNNGDGSFTIGGSGNLSENYSNPLDLKEILKCLKVGKITFKCGAKTNPTFRVRFAGANGDVFVLMNNNINDSSHDITQEELNKITNISLLVYGQSGEQIIPGTIKPMLYQDGDGTWEPFTGGKPSPSPEYPQEIESVGKEDGGKYAVKVKTTGKNIFDFESALKEGKNAYEKISDDEFEVKNIGNFYSNPFRILDEDRTVTLSGTVKSIGSGSSWMLELMNMKNEVVCTTSTSIKSGRGSKIRMNYSTAGQGGLFKDIQVEIGAEQTPFQPYKEFTASIQLDSSLYDGDYIYLENGELWEYRENARVVFDGSEDEVFNKYSEDAGVINFITAINGCKIGYKTSLCDKYRNVNGSWNMPEYGIYSDHMNSTTKYFHQPNPDVQTVEQWREWLKSNPLEIAYKLATPTRKRLDIGSEEAIKTLKTYYPITHISNSDGAEMVVEYVVDTRLYIDGKFKELQETIVNTQTQMLKGV